MDKIMWKGNDIGELYRKKTKKRYKNKKTI